MFAWAGRAGRAGRACSGSSPFLVQKDLYNLLGWGEIIWVSFWAAQTRVAASRAWTTSAAEANGVRSAGCHAS